MTRLQIKPIRVGPLVDGPLFADQEDSTSSPDGCPTPSSQELAKLFQHTRGPRDARIVLVGESWGYNEAQCGIPFVGNAGRELDRMLNEAGVDPATILFTNVVHERPANNDMWHFFHARKDKQPELWGLHPRANIREGIDRLYALLDHLGPDLVIAAGNYAFWALSDEVRLRYDSGAGGTVIPTGIVDWRGSMLWSRESPAGRRYPVLPVFHPSAILNNWGWRWVTVHDFTARVPFALAHQWSRDPTPTFIYLPTFDEAALYLWDLLKRLEEGPTLVAGDCETKRGLMTCFGFCYEDDRAFCLPFITLTPDGTGFTSYWSVSEEAALTRLFILILTHPNLQMVGQNFMYDLQYLYTGYWLDPHLELDTMLAYHLLYPGTPKGLGQISSIFCDYHRYWKDDNHEWDGHGNVAEHFLYNAEDCLRTYEIGKKLLALVKLRGKETQLRETMERHELAWDMMKRGVRIDKARRSRAASELRAEKAELEQRLLTIIPQEMSDPKAKSKWFDSPKQLATLFYERMGFPVQRHKKTKQPTTDDSAIEALKKKVPDFAPLFELISDLRSVNVFFRNFVQTELEPNGRMVCSFNVSGTETFRWSSSTNAYRRGGNLQNIPSGNEED